MAEIDILTNSMTELYDRIKNPWIDKVMFSHTRTDFKEIKSWDKYYNTW